MKARAFWQDMSDTIFGGTGRVINLSFEAIGGGRSNIRLTREQATAVRDQLDAALKEESK